MIAVESLAARDAPLTLSPMTFTLDRGVHAILGGIPDGVALLLSVMAGRARVRRGRVLVLGKPIAEVARSVAFVPRVPPLPDALTVTEMLDVAARIRGDASTTAEARLAPLGIESLAPRRIRSLTPPEAHAVALAEALTSKAVRVLLLDEPFASVDPRAAALLAERIRDRAKDGACVVVATASPRDASALASSVLVLSKGVLLRHDDTLSLGSHRLHVVASDPRALVAALAKDASVLRVALDGAGVVVEGGDRTAVATAIARAAVDAGVDLVEMRADVGGPP